MDEERFRSFCAKRGLDASIIQANVLLAREFETFLNRKDRNRNMSNAVPDDLENFACLLIENGTNTWENFLALLRYARFASNREAEIALLELMDGSDVLENLSETLRQTVGESKRDDILAEVKLPPLGTSSKEKPKITKKFMERLEAKLDEKTCREILLSGPHAGPREEYLPERKEFLASKSIDDFLAKRHRKYLAALEKHVKEKTLYFTQEIDQGVLEYVRNTPTCQNGVRDGDIIYITKIPYNAKKCLHEKDEKKKRYYYCHCPWVREAIKSGVKISPNFCYCSAGFEKRPWDVIFDQPVEADVIETVLKGDLVCKFAIHIPKSFHESKGTTQKKRKE
ncbi:hypothetical protein MUP01_09430 [Candidatus Bathyarchaeota archaeon]|nr:hypothetical protein [Candidatus Bathyarchaeota archaeon]